MTESNSSKLKFLHRDYWYKIRREPKAMRRFVARRLFRLFERAGLHVTADHFYEIIPNIQEVREKYNAGPRPCLGIDFRRAASEKHLFDLIARWGGDFYDEAAQEGYYRDNNYFRAADALTLYCVLRDLKPARVIEIGHGFSTRVTLAALRKNNAETGNKARFLSIDPYARFVPNAAASAAVDFEICRKPIQDAVDLVIDSLEPGDLLFVDSTHVFKHGSDVELYFDQIFPRLPAGVHLHVHDIFSPYDYPLDWIYKHRRFWNEQYYLENFLRFNDKFEITVPLHMLLRESEPVRTAIRGGAVGNDHLYAGQSLYLRRTI